MKKSLRFIALGGILALSIPAFLALSQNTKSVSAYNASSLPTTIDLNDTSASNIRSYYSSLNNLSQSERQGTNLLKNLKTILKDEQKYFSYESGENIWKMYEITDRDWVKSPASAISGYNSSTNKITGYTYNTTDPYIHALYINRDVNNQTTAWSDHQQTQWGINREHVWPKAEGFDTSGAGGARGDPMHLMAGNGYANNIHSNYYYGYVKTSSSYTDCGSKYSNQSGNLRGTSKTLNTGTVFEPQDCDKGDIARAIFYMVARYNYYSGSDSDGIDTNNPNLVLTQSVSDWSSTGYTSSTSKQGKMGIMTDLLAWHKADPVDEYEIHRNNLLYKNFTNNRNPFIDFPEWANFIWGSVNYNGSTYVSNSTTPTGYATPSTDTINGYNGGGTVVSVTGVSLNKNSASISVDGAETLEATVAPNNATNQNVTWTSSNTNIATVTNGTVRGVAEGTAIITVTTSDGGFTDTCTVTVTSSGGGGGDDTYYQKCTSLSEIQNGGKYVLLGYKSSSTQYYAMPAYTSGNNIQGVTVTLTENGTKLPEENMSTANVWTLTSTGTTNQYYIGDGSSYLYAAGTGTNNYLKAKSGTDSSAGAFTITYSTFFSVVAASNNRNTMRFNAGNNPPIFSCYASNDNQTEVMFFKEVKGSTPEKPTLTSIELDTSDAPTTFNVGDEWSYEGLSVTANYSDGSSDIVSPTYVSTPNMGVAGTKTVTVSYTEDGETQEASYEITVNAPTLTSIEVSNAKTSYYVGDTFVKPTVTATFSNGSTSSVADSSTFTGYNMSTAGNQTVTVSYTSSGVTKTTSYSITVTAVALTSISVSDYETSFEVGDTFSFGGTVTAHYNNGSTSNVTSSASFSGYDMSTAGNQTVTVSYGGQTTSYSILVSEPSSDETATVVIQDYASAHSWVNGTTYESVSIDSVATATMVGTGNNGKYYTSGYEWRFYQNGSGGITISVLENYVIDSVTINYNINNTGIFIDSNSNTVVSGVEQTVDAQSVTYTVANSGDATNGQAKITSISITYHLASADPMTSIIASTDKTFAVGEIISTSDISVRGDNGQVITDFSFANTGYKFSYSDAASGGAFTSKTFTNAVTYETFTCSLTVNVARTAYQEVVDSSNEFTGAEFKTAGIASSYTEDQDVTVDGIAFNVDGYIYSNKLSLSSSQTYAPGKVVNTAPFSTGITNVTVAGATPDIQLSTNGTSWVDLDKATPNTVNYYYLQIYYKTKSQTAYVNISSFTVTTKGVETAVNVANYVMFEDTTNQCVTKFDIASGYFNNLSASERATFMTSGDYVISTARDRFEAWARYHGKTISYENSDYTIKNASPASIMLGNSFVNNSQTLIIVLVSSLVGISVIGGYFFLRKRKEQ